MPAGVVNGKSLKGAKRALAIQLLGNGETMTAVALRLRKSRDVIRSVAETEFVEVSRAKERIANLSQQIAQAAGDAMLHDVRCRRVKGSALVPVFGVAVDKMQLLRGEPQFTFRHEHFHRVSDDDLIAFALARSGSGGPSPKLANVLSVEDQPPSLADSSNLPDCVCSSGKSKSKKSNGAK